MSRASYNTMPALSTPFNLAVERPPSGSNLSSSSSIVTVKRANAPPTVDSPGQRPLQIVNTTSPLKSKNLDETLAEQWGGTSPQRMHIHNVSTDDSGSEGTTGPSRWSGSTDSSEPSAGIKRHNSISARFGLKASRIGRYGAAKRAASPPRMRYPAHTRPIAESSDIADPTTTAPILTSGQSLTTDSPGSLLRRAGTGASSGPGLRISTSGPDQTPLAGPWTGNNHHSGQRTGYNGEIDSGQGRTVSHNDTTSREALSPMRSKSLRDKDKKTMLSRALQRANAAVELDNAQDYLGAMEAYAEACDYLNRVMGRSSNEEDKRKLQAIRATYTARVEELSQLEAQWKHVDNNPTQQNDASSQSSPIRLGVDEALDESLEESDTSPTVSTATLIEVGNLDQRLQPSESKVVGGASGAGNIATRVDLGSRSGYDHSQTSQVRSTSPHPTSNASLPTTHAPRNSSPTFVSTSLDLDSNGRAQFERNSVGPTKSTLIGSEPEPRRLSRSSSKHSVSSTNGIRRKNLRLRSGNTEAEFDAALDAAVEAAYDDGYEPFEETESPVGHSQYSDIARSPQTLYAYNSFAERQAARDYATEYRQLQPDATESDDEERMLEEITRDFMMDNHTFDEQAKSAIPRQSDSSGSSGQTWGSSDASSVVTNGTPLSPVNEHSSAPAIYLKQHSRNLPPPTPPPTAALPQLPPSAASSQALSGQPGVLSSQNQSVQDRRLVGQKTKKLQIRTAVVTAPLPEDQLNLNASDAPHAEASLIPAVFSFGQASGDSKPIAIAPIVTGSYVPHLSSPHTSPIHAEFSSKSAFNFSSPTSTLNSAVAQDNTLGPSPPSNSPAELLARPSSTRPPPGRNFSSLSLRNRVRSSPTADTSDASPGTPVKFGFATIPPPGRKSPLNMLSSGVPAPVVQVQQGKKVHLFSNEIHAPQSSDSPSNQLQLPRALEPCPESTLLRPFWLMRCIYQTIVHPRGGYLTTKLFVPRDVWIVKNVKLKGVEEKVAACDLLTAALSKLAAVNAIDADALLTEMSALETAMDHAQSSLTRKLGNDVGPQHVSSLFKDAPPLNSNGPSSEKLEATSSTEGGANASTGSFGGNTNKSAGKSSLVSSWRKLRSKSSGTSLATSFASVKDQPRESLTLSTLPMASSSVDGPPQRATRSHNKRPSSARNELRADGPNAHYMGALARLCEAVQVLDQIARQVEDPGLKTSSPTHVGLELGMRHAAEFLGFYICRFVLQDVTMLADKYVKRATEWVLL